jgi:hypothetical protein
MLDYDYKTDIKSAGSSKFRWGEPSSWKVLIQITPQGIMVAYPWCSGNPISRLVTIP